MEPNVAILVTTGLVTTGHKKEPELQKIWFELT